MYVALIVTTALLAIIAANSAAMKLRKNQQVIDSIHGTVGVPLRFIPALAALEIAGAVGIVAGLWLGPIGVAAAAGLTAYFVGAVLAHLRVGDTKGLLMPLGPLALSVAVLVLRILTL